VAATLVAVPVVTVLASPAAAATPTHAFPTHVTYQTGVMPSAPQATRDAAVEKAYDAWKATYLVQGCAANEYYVSTKGDSDAKNNGPVSEGQGYGMNIVPLMAGYDASAQTEFNGLWQLVKDHEDVDGMMQWQLDGKTCKYYSNGTPDGATDGDLDIGYGLILADKQWGGYSTDAETWLTNFYNHNVAPDGHLKCEDDGPNTDTRPSDMMIDHLRAFAAYDPSHDWNKVVTRTEAVISEFTAAYSPNTGLLSDFVVGANTTGPKPAPAKYQENQPDNIVGYNSIRVPWHLGTDALLYPSAGVTLATATKESSCLKAQSGGVPTKVFPHTNLDCTPRSTDGDGHSDVSAEEAGDSIGPAAMASGDQAWTDAIWAELGTNPFGDGYFGETIKMLVYIVMAGDYWSPDGGVTPPTSTPPTTTPTTSPTTTPAPGGTSYEAESAALAGGARVSSCAHCSGGKRVGNLGNGGTVTFKDISEAGAGDQTLTIYYQSPAAPLSAVITVDGVDKTVAFPATSDHDIGSVTLVVTLAAGSGNTIVYANATAAAPYLDRIVV
jgi:endo-1,4-beta-D-glucanase Y